MGNAIVPQAAEYIMRAVVAREARLREAAA